MILKNIKTIHINSNNLNYANNIMKKNKNILMFYLAEWCTHCKAIKPEIKKLFKSMKNKKGNIVLMTVMEDLKNDIYLDSYFVKGYPTIALYKDKKVIMYEGKRTTKDIISFINKHTKAIKKYKKKTKRRIRKKRKKIRKKTRKKTKRRIQRKRKKTRKKRKKRIRRRGGGGIRRIYNPAPHIIVPQDNDDNENIQEDPEILNANMTIQDLGRIIRDIPEENNDAADEEVATIMGESIGKK